MFWTILAQGLAPLGFLTCACLLSGFNFFENLGMAICGACIKIGIFDLRLDRICALLSVIAFSVEAFKLNGETADATTVEMQDRQVMTRWRHERNYWISLYMLTLWVVAGRVAYLVDFKRRERPKWE